MDRVEMLAAAIRGMSASELQALSSVLAAERNTRKAGWTFLQKVYIRYTGVSNANYLSNFAEGRVLYADKEVVRVVGKNGKMFLTVPNEKDGNTLYSAKRFSILRASMFEKKAFWDPKSPPAAKMLKRVALVDEIFAEEVPLRANVKKERGRRDDLVSIISRMSRGVLSERSKKMKAGDSGEISFKY